MEQLKISVIIPAYNVEKYIVACLESVINQTYKNLEILVIDDGSTDNTLDMINNIKDTRIRVLTQCNKGISAARNKGIVEATGDFISFLDSDDWLEKDALEKLYQCIKTQNVDVVRGSYYTNKDKTNSYIVQEKCLYLKNKKILKNSKEMQEFLEQIISETVSAYVWLLLINKKILEDVIMFDETISVSEDLLFYVDILCRCNSIYLLGDCIYHHYVNDDSITKKLDNSYKIIEDRIVLSNKLKNSVTLYDFKEFKDSIINANCMKVILVNLYKMSLVDKKNFKKVYQYLQNDSNVIAMQNNVKLSLISIKEKISIYLFKKNYFYLLNLYFIIRSFLKRLK